MPATKNKNFVIAVLKGIIVGAAAIIPGASGGVLAVSMGIYRPILDAVCSFFSTIRSNFLFLLPYGIGGVLGLLATAQGLEWLLLHFHSGLMYTLVGMVLGGIPSLLEEANNHGFKKRYLLATLGGALFLTILAYLNHSLAGGNNWAFNYWTAAICGGILAVGIVIPGVSTSFLVMYLGLYDSMLSALNNFKIVYLFFAGLGAVVVGGILLLFVKRMFDRHPGFSYYAVLGFLLGTIVLIFPGVTFTAAQLLYLVLLAAGLAATYFLCKLTNSK